MEVDINHIHILVKYKPKISILQIVRKLKQISTVNIWKSYSEELKVHFWKENTFWSDGYFACSIGNVSKETIVSSNVTSTTSKCPENPEQTI